MTAAWITAAVLLALALLAGVVFVAHVLEGYARVALPAAAVALQAASAACFLIGALVGSSSS